MQKDLLKLLDLTKNDIVKILDTADQMKYNQKHGLTHHYLEGKTLAMIFEKKPVCSSWAATLSSSPVRRARLAEASLSRIPPECSAATVTAS